MANARKLFAIVFLLPSILLSGCLTVIRGPNEEVHITSEPAGAKVTLKGVEVGITPIDVKIPRGSGGTLILDKEGYKASSVSFLTSNNLALTYLEVFILIFIPPFISFIVDVACSAHKDITPSSFNVVLEPITPVGK